MCLMIPGKVKKNNKVGFVIGYRESESRVSNSLIKNVKIGDWVIIQNKFITQKLSNQQARDFFQLIKK